MSDDAGRLADGSPQEPTAPRRAALPGVDGEPGDDAPAEPGVDAPAEPGAHPAPASLVRMANQIASNAAHKPHDVAVRRTADHLREFWHPSMIRDLQAYVATGGTGLTPLAAESLAALS